MDVIRGIQSNCSELVIYIDNHTYDEAINIMAEAKIHEVIARNFYSQDDEETGDWDGEHVTKEIVQMTPELKQLFNTYDYGNDAEQQDSGKKLKDRGYDPWKSTTMLLEDGTTPDNDNGGVITIRNNHDTHAGPVVIAHQHCQVQLFPLMRKLSQLFDKEPQGYDGGSNMDYNEWLDQQNGVSNEPDL